VAESDAHLVLQVALADLGLHLASADLGSQSAWCALLVPEVAQPDEPVLVATVEFVELAQSAQLVNSSKVHQVGLAARMKLRDSPHHHPRAAPQAHSAQLELAPQQTLSRLLRQASLQQQLTLRQRQTLRRQLFSLQFSLHLQLFSRQQLSSLPLFSPVCQKLLQVARRELVLRDRRAHECDLLVRQ
jgi:hypothetical protein